MQLAPGERSILATFPSANSAQKAAAGLKNAGFQTVSVDRISRYGVENDAEINSAVAGRATSLAGLTLYSAGTNPGDERVLLAADPSVSGYGDTNYGVAGGRAFLVTVVTSKEKVEQAAEILKQHGGQV